MNVTTRSFLTAGIAAVGASAIAVSPVQPMPEHAGPAQTRAVSTLAVSLAATVNPITLWTETLQKAAANIKTLGEFYMQKPLPLLTTIGANIGTYAGELQSGNANLIPGQIQNNIKTFFEAPWWNKKGTVIPNDTFANQYISGTDITKVLFLTFSQQTIYGLLPGFLTPEQKEQLGPLLEFTATPYSGQLAGLVSPILGSLVQTVRSFTAVGDLFKAGDIMGAVNELINIPANVTNAALNGVGYLDLTSIAGSLLPPEIKTIGLNLGGWISPPVPYNGSVLNNRNPPTKFTGGTFFDAVAATAQAAGLDVATPGLPETWMGSVIGLGQFLGENMLVTPPPPATAAVAPAAAAATPAVPATPAEPATPAIPAEDEAPATPAIPATPAERATPALPDTPAPSHRGGGNDNSDNGGKSGGRNHRGAA